MYKRLNSFLNLVYTLLTKNRSSSHFCRRAYFSKVKDTHRENSPSNKTKALTTSMDMCIWEIGLLNQLFISSSYTETKFKKKEVFSGKTAFFVIGLFCTPHPICLNIGF